MINHRELTEIACDHADETARDEQLAYWKSSPRNGGHFPPKPEVGWLVQALSRTPDDGEWEYYQVAYRNALLRAIKVVVEKWDPESDDLDHHDDTYIHMTDAINGVL